MKKRTDRFRSARCASQSPPCRRLNNKTRFEQVGIRLCISRSLATAVVSGRSAILDTEQDSLNISVGLYQIRLGRTRQNAVHFLCCI